MRRTTLAGLIVVAVLAAGCSKKKEADEGRAEGGAALSGSVRVDGSSTVFPISEAVAEEFQQVERNVRVTVGISGTGGGFKKLCAGEVEIANASRPIKPSEVELCSKSGMTYIELPIAYDGIAMVVNPKNDWATSITVPELRKIWEPEAQGKVMKWSDVREGWPDRELRLYGAGVDSGTYDYFTEAVVGREHASRGDYTSSEDDNVIVQGVSNDVNALGFFGFAYYAENRDKLRALPIDDLVADNGEGAIPPTVETIRDGTYQPLSRPVFIYVSAKALEQPQVKAFVDFYLKNAADLVGEVGYVPLPATAYTLAAEKVAQRRIGSAFGGKGSQVGVSIEALLRSGTGAQPSGAGKAPGGAAPAEQ